MDLLELLVEKHIISKEKASQLKSEIQASGGKPEELLLAEKIVDEDTLFRLKSGALKIVLKHVDSEEIPLKVLELIPEDSAKYYKMIALGQKGDALEIGMVYPEDIRAQEALQFLARQGNFSYHIFLIGLSTFENVMKRYRDSKREMRKALEELEEEMREKTEGGKEVFKESRIVEEAPITKMVAVILQNAVEGGASDIHIEPTREKLRVRFRFLGELHPSLFLPMKVHSAIVARIKILANMKIDETRIPQDGRFSTMVEGKMIDFRVATFPTPLGEKAALRVLDPATGLRSFKELGVYGMNFARIKEAIEKPFGLILITGPTGSGKSTTMYAILQYLNKDNVNIISLEDPVEYFIGGVNQSQVRPEIGYDFAQGLRQVLRQDPNIIMVGEVRDKETAALVIHAALTGHIVLSTLHTNSAVGVAPRLLDMGVDKYLIPATLSLAIAQRLLRRLCEVCREKIKAQKAIRDMLFREIEQFPQVLKEQMPLSHILETKEVLLFEPKGCRKCGSSGFAGRIAIIEVLIMTPELGDIILKEPSEVQIGKEALRQGMVTMRQDGILKALEGVTTLEEVLRATAE